MVGGALPFPSVEQDQRQVEAPRVGPIFTLRVRCRVNCEAWVVRSNDGVSVECASGVHVILVAASALDDHHLPLLDPADRAAAIHAICDSGDTVWARAACLGIARDLCAEAGELLRGRIPSPGDLARACLALLDAAHWRTLARTCNLTLEALRKVA